MTLICLVLAHRKELNKEIQDNNLGDAIKAQVPEGKKNPNKKTKIAAVIEARKLLIAHDNQWVANRRNKVKESLPTRQDLSQTVVRVFQKELYTFKSTAAYRRYRDGNKIRMKLNPTETVPSASFGSNEGPWSELIAAFGNLDIGSD